MDGLKPSACASAYHPAAKAAGCQYKGPPTRAWGRPGTADVLVRLPRAGGDSGRSAKGVGLKSPATFKKSCGLGVPRWPQTTLAWLGFVLLVAPSCGTDELVAPSSFGSGVVHDAAETAVASSDALETTDLPPPDVVFWRGQDDVYQPADVALDTAPQCPGKLGCTCVKHSDCFVGVCLAVPGVGKRCVEPCAQVPPLAEVCDGLDDDCDGLTDEVPCDDGNACTTELCETAKGCVFLPLPGTCTDGEVCTVADGCSGGVCKAGPAKDCNDGEGCTADTCVTGIGCLHTVIAGPCDDGSVCTAGEACATGKCTGGQWQACDDTNVCTIDTCKDSTGCIHAATGGPCEDGDLLCTIGDVCGGGECKPGPTLTCDDGQACTSDSCDKAKGCLHTAKAGPCDDGNPCTSGDGCDGGDCKGGSPTLCDDAKPCTLDACDAKAGCTASPSTLPCSDGNVCTVGDVCGGAGCAPGLPLACSDGNPCTDDSCAPTQGCVFLDNSAACNDGNACTKQDVCIKGVCQAATAGACDDANPCTSDSCDPAAGCDNQPNKLPCVDGDACTAFDTCVDGKCTAGKATQCQDGNPCTSDGCAPSSGCVFLADPKAKCSDGNPCSQGDHCGSGVCQGKSALQCDDGNPCTSDGCSVEAGCVHAVAAGPCDDGNPCTAADSCAAGKCKGGNALLCNDGNPCTTDTCTANAGCAYSASAGTCDDGNACTTGEACAKGQCAGGKGVVCSDGNVCTLDSCNSAQGCTFTVANTPCNDGDACTVAETCAGGKCGGGKAVVCDDQNPCTAETCAPQLGCTAKAANALCSDGSACTLDDQCVGGSCVGGKQLPCNDNNPCTNDDCQPQKGCFVQPNTAPCNDGDACTSDDVCKAATCKGTAKGCDDSNTCTTDACDKNAGCLHVPNAQPCSDGTLCTSGDVCKNGNCVGNLVNCDDKNPCTVDQCTSAVGCGHPALPNDTVCGGSGICWFGKCTPGSEVTPAVSCKQILQARPKAPSGVYWLDPDQGDGANKYQVFCDMVSYGGGWLRVDNQWAQKLLVMQNPSPTQGKCALSSSELRAWDGFDGAPGYGHLCIASRLAGNWMPYQELRVEGVVLTGYTAGKGHTYDLSFDCYGLKSKGAFCAGPNDFLVPAYGTQQSLGNGEKLGPTSKLVDLGKVWTDFQVRAREEGPQLEGIVWNSGVFLLR